MKVFVESEAGSNQKKLYDEKTLAYKRTMSVSRAYPYPYGFILDTTNVDGDNLDCFIITDTRLESGKMYECEPIGLMEQFETAWEPEKKGEEEKDHNILAILSGESREVDESVKTKLTEFVSHVFDHIPHHKNRVGQFLGKEEALEEMRKLSGQIKK